MSKYLTNLIARTFEPSLPTITPRHVAFFEAAAPLANENGWTSNQYEPAGMEEKVSFAIEQTNIPAPPPARESELQFPSRPTAPLITSSPDSIDFELPLMQPSVDATPTVTPDKSMWAIATALTSYPGSTKSIEAKPKRAIHERQPVISEVALFPDSAQTAKNSIELPIEENELPALTEVADKVFYISSGNTINEILVESTIPNTREWTQQVSQQSYPSEKDQRSIIRSTIRPVTALSQTPVPSFRRNHSASSIPAVTPASPPTINVTIGRIEIKAVSPASTSTPSQRQTPASHTMSLNEYMRLHTRGGGSR